MESAALINLQERLDRIDSKLVSLESKLQPEKRDLNQSPTIGLVALALSKAQGEFPIILKSKIGNFLETEYAELDHILTVVRPILSKYELALRQYTEDSEYVTLYTRIVHSSGEFLGTSIRFIPTKNNIRSFDSCCTFYRKVSIKTLLGIHVRGDDDNGLYEMSEAKEKQLKGTDPVYIDPMKKDDESRETISKHEYSELEIELEGWPNLVNDIYESYQINRLMDLPKSAYRKVITQIRTNKIALSKSR